MSIHDLADILTAIGALIGAIGSVWSLIATQGNRRRIEIVQQSTNGMKNELVKAEGDKRFLEGVRQGEQNGNGNGNGKG